MTIRLSDFVRDAITEIAFGIHEAKAETYELIAVVPGRLDGATLNEKSYIEFDIAVTATSEESRASSKRGKAGAGIAVWAAKIGADGELSSEVTSKEAGTKSSRIAFKVPVYFNANFRGDPNSRIEAEFVRSKSSERSSPETN